MTRIVSILILIIVTSCSSKTEIKKEYSKEFEEYFKNSEIKLKSDSLIFPKEAGYAIVLIPTELEIYNDYYFIDSLGQDLMLKRINYTDIEFELKTANSSEKGIVSLSPHFYVGMETIETKGEMYSLTYYDVKSKNSIITRISIGTKNTGDEIEPFAYIIPNRKMSQNNLIQGWEIMNLK